MSSDLILQKLQKLFSHVAYWYIVIFLYKKCNYNQFELSLAPSIYFILEKEKSVLKKLFLLTLSQKFFYLKLDSISKIKDGLDKKVLKTYLAYQLINLLACCSSISQTKSHN